MNTAIQTTASTPEEAQEHLWQMARGMHDCISARQLDELATSGMNLNQLFGKTGQSALHTACGIDNLAIVDKLIAKGADVNICDALKGRTPLHWAANISLKEQTCLALLKAGADINQCDNDGRPPIEIAAERFENSPFKLDLHHILIGAGARITPDMVAHYPCLKAPYDHSVSRLDAWHHHAQGDVTALTAQHLTDAANLGMLSTLMAPALWQGHGEHLTTILSELPDYFCKRLLTEQPELAAIIAQPSTLVLPKSVTQQPIHSERCR